MLAPRVVAHDSSFVAMIAWSKNTGSGLSCRSRIRMARICSASMGLLAEQLTLVGRYCTFSRLWVDNHKGPSVGARELHPERVSIHKPLQAVALFEWRQYHRARIAASFARRKCSCAGADSRVRHT